MVRRSTFKVLVSGSASMGSPADSRTHDRRKSYRGLSVDFYWQHCTLCNLLYYMRITWALYMATSSAFMSASNAAPPWAPFHHVNELPKHIDWGGKGTSSHMKCKANMGLLAHVFEIIPKQWQNATRYIYACRLRLKHYKAYKEHSMLMNVFGVCSANEEESGLLQTLR